MSLRIIWDGWRKKVPPPRLGSKVYPATSLSFRSADMTSPRPTPVIMVNIHCLKQHVPYIYLQVPLTKSFYTQIYILDGVLSHLVL